MSNKYDKIDIDEMVFGPLPRCPYCKMSIGDPEEHKIICLTYAHDFKPWWYDLAAVMVWTIAIIGGFFLINAITKI